MKNALHGNVHRTLPFMINKLATHLLLMMSQCQTIVDDACVKFIKMYSAWTHVSFMVLNNFFIFNDKNMPCNHQLKNINCSVLTLLYKN